MDGQVARMAEEYTAALRLQQVSGVGTPGATSFALLMEDPGRFRKRRDVGP